MAPTTLSLAALAAPPTAPPTGTAMPPEAADTIIQAAPTQLLRTAPAARTPAPARCHHGARCFAIAAATFLFIAIELGVLALEGKLLGLWHL